MKTLIYSALLFAIIFFSCSSEDMVSEIEKVSESDTTPKIEIIKIYKTTKSSLSSDTEEPEQPVEPHDPGCPGEPAKPPYETIVKFRDKEVLNETLAVLDEMTAEEQKEWASENLEDFVSIRDIYDQAMEEAESYYDREGGYEEFKEKYPTLYYPEEGEDYGAYIPFQDELIANVLNENGQLIVGEEIIEEPRIDHYDKLKATRRGYYEEKPKGLYDNDDPKDSPPDYLVDISKDNVYAYFMTPPVWFFEKRIIGPENTSGWIKYSNGKKIKVNLRRITKTNYILGILPGGFRLEWHVEICFRKKGFLGFWYNYSSKSTSSVLIIYPNREFASPQAGIYNRSGFSSHDINFKAYVERLYKREGWKNIYDAKTKEWRSFPKCLYRMPAYFATVQITHRGIPETVKVNFYEPTIYGYTDYSSDKLE